MCQSAIREPYEANFRPKPLAEVPFRNESGGREPSDLGQPSGSNADVCRDRKWAGFVLDAMQLGAKLMFLL